MIQRPPAAPPPPLTLSPPNPPVPAAAAPRYTGATVPPRTSLVTAATPARPTDPPQTPHLPGGRAWLLARESAAGSALTVCLIALSASLRGWLGGATGQLV